MGSCGNFLGRGTLMYLVHPCRPAQQVRHVLRALEGTVILSAAWRFLGNLLLVARNVAPGR